MRTWCWTRVGAVERSLARRLSEVFGGVQAPGGVPALDTFPSQLVDLDAVRRMAEGRDVSALSFCDDVAAFRSAVRGRISLPGKRTKLSQEMVVQCVDAGLLVKKKRKDALRGVVTLFSIPKRDPLIHRLIVDGRPVNSAMIDPPKFSLPGPRELSELLLHSGAQVACSIDMKGWFYQFALSKGVREYFGVRHGSTVYHFARMPMGWSFAPAIAQTTSEVLLGWMRGRCAAAIIDDIIVTGPDVRSMCVRRDYLMSRVREAKAELSVSKSELEPRKVITFGGVEWHLPRRRLRLPEDWRLKARVLVGTLVSARSVALREVWKVVGRVVWTFFATGEWLASMSRLLQWVSGAGQRVAAGTWSWEEVVSLPGGVRDELRRFAEVHLVPNTWRVGHMRRPVSFDVVIWTDASPEGWGIVAQGCGRRAADEAEGPQKRPQVLLRARHCDGRGRRSHRRSLSVSLSFAPRFCAWITKRTSPACCCVSDADAAASADASPSTFPAPSTAPDSSFMRPDPSWYPFSTASPNPTGGTRVHVHRHPAVAGPDAPRASPASPAGADRRRHRRVRAVPRLRVALHRRPLPPRRRLPGSSTSLSAASPTRHPADARCRRAPRPSRRGPRGEERC